MTLRNALTLATLFALVSAFYILQVAADDPPVSLCHDVVARSASGKTRRVNLDWLAEDSFAMYPTDNQEDTFHFSVCGNRAECLDEKVGACWHTGTKIRKPAGVWPNVTPTIILDENASPFGSIILETGVINGEKTRMTIHCNPYMFGPANYSYQAPRPTPGVRVHQLSFGYYAACGDEPLKPIPGMCSKLIVADEKGEKHAHFNLDELSQVGIFSALGAQDFDARFSHLFGVCGNVNCHIGFQEKPRMVGACFGEPQEYPDPTTHITSAMYSSDIRDLKFTWITNGFPQGALRIELPEHAKHQVTIFLICDPNMSEINDGSATTAYLGAPPPWKHVIHFTHRTGCGRPL